MFYIPKKQNFIEIHQIETYFQKSKQTKIIFLKNLNFFEFSFLYSKVLKVWHPGRKTSGKENVQLPDSPNFDNFLDFWNGRDVLYSPKILVNLVHIGV